jgi:hypothetical protein
VIRQQKKIFRKRLFETSYTGRQFFYSFFEEIILTAKQESAFYCKTRFIGGMKISLSQHGYPTDPRPRFNSKL